MNPDTKQTRLLESALRYESALNPAQMEAVMFREGPLLVVAGAGSGKTRTLTYRVARLVETGTPPAAILLLTFTRKAAQEMLDRSVGLLDTRCRQVSGGTFHSFSAGLLRRYSARIGFEEGFTIVDRADAEALIAGLRKQLRLKDAQGSFPNKRTLANIFSRAVNKGQGVEDIVRREFPHFAEHMEEILGLHQSYAAAKRDHKVVDYDDLLVMLFQLLETHGDIREIAASRYRYILVDEYQDTNALQASILHLLGRQHGNVMAVGDDAQSIYAFRGANFENIMTFPDLFPGTRVVKLEENYRSTQPILDVTNAIIDQAARRFTKRLFTQKTGGRLPALVTTLTEKSQSRFVVDTVLGLRRNGVPLGRMAVLFRAGFHSFDLEIELNREAIPFVKVGGFKFMESAHIKDMLAHLRVLVNPYDRISWTRALLLVDRIGPGRARTVCEALAACGAGYRGLSVSNHPSIRKKELDGLRKLYEDIGAMKAPTPGEIATAVLAYYTPILRKTFDDHPRRLRDLEQLITILERYADLAVFLSDMALEPPANSVDDRLSEAGDPENRLVLSTVHSAKGLEWHTVFILWAMDGRFPSAHAVDDPSDLEEELRLMYVAATRARENLYFLSPAYAYDRITRSVFTRPSRFIADLPEAILIRANPDGHDGFGRNGRF